MGRRSIFLNFSRADFGGFSSLYAYYEQLSVLEKVVSGFEPKLWKLTYTTNPFRPHGMGSIFVAIGPILNIFDVYKTSDQAPQLLPVRSMLK